MRETITQHTPVMTRTERKRLAFLTSTHVVDDLYAGHGGLTAWSRDCIPRRIPGKTG
jgi:hypothetical protein